MSEYFSYDHLKQLKAAEGRVLKNVLYHLWINKTDSNERFEFLDKLELQFEGHNLIITASETDEAGLTLADDFDGEKYRLMLLHEFGGKIDIQSESMNTNALWENAVNKKLIKLGVAHEGDNIYSNKAIMLDFGDTQLEITPGIDGVMVDYYEE